jgi:23S rRNA (guanosine2251-2'-O)-methyltransferase
VLELLIAGRRRVKVITMSATLEGSELIDEILERAHDAGVRIDEVPAGRLAAVARTDAPQGVVAKADPLPATELDALLAVERPFLVALDGVTDPHNLGAILRTAETAGVTGVLLPRHRSAHLSPTVTKAAAGAIEYLDIALVSGIPQALDRARRADVWSVGLDEGGTDSIYELALADGPLVLVLGAEGRGLARLTRERCDVLASIPMTGHIASLNVSNAAAVACHAIAQRRAAASRD